MPSLWGICQHKCYIKQAKKKKRRVGRYVEDCNIILFPGVERPQNDENAQEFCVEYCSEEFFFDFLNEWP